MPIEPIGRGIAFPVVADERGGIATSSGEQKVRESILIILGTFQGERVMRPEFGSRLRSLVFAENNSATANLARFFVMDALERWEPRIAVREVRVANVEGERGPELRIEILYALKATAQAERLGFTLAIG